jgi:hypothetical protein
MSATPESAADTWDAQKTSPPDDCKDCRWSVMVFMGADTVAGNAPLAEAATADLVEMESIGSDTRLDIMVQVHGRGEPQRCHIGAGPNGKSENINVPENERDLSRGQALGNFIRWALTQSRYDPNDEHHFTMLVLWGHAYDFAINRTHNPNGTIDALDFAELSGVLERLQLQFGAAEGTKLDILAFDACDLATVEMACQLQPFAKYLIGSQIGIPIPGWPYDRILERLHTPIGRIMGPSELGSWIVRRFCESYPATSPVSLSFLDLKRTSALFAHAEVLALTLDRAIQDLDVRDLIAYIFLRSQTDEGRPYVDVADLCLGLVRESGDPVVIEAARALGDFLISPAAPLVGLSLDGAGRPFVLEHGRNAGSTARLNGISIYAPHVAPEIDFESVRHLYQNFDFAQNTRWSDLVHTLARRR